jgi:glycosyltransferase involved in cell wall biosynthesis
MIFASLRKISFCTTCRNRLWQFLKTFEVNAELVGNKKDVEWIILDFCSADRLDDYMTSVLPNFSKRIVYIRLIDNLPWHVSVAKNMAHSFATGDILANLDCDNFIGHFWDMIRVGFKNDNIILHNWSGISGDGTFGRIALTKNTFHSLGGYDERFFPMGYQDTDLLNRARCMGFHYLRALCYPSLAIPNTKKESIANCNTGNLTWLDYQQMNREISRINIKNKIFRANDGIRQKSYIYKILYGQINDI